jgi:putative membrane protein
VVKLAAHPGIWFVAGREGGQVIIASSLGILSLDGEEQVTEGENPLGIVSEPDIAAEQIRRLVQFPHSGDLILMGGYDPGKQEVVCFEKQWACHGGLGGPQDYPFMVFPSETGMNLDAVTNSEQLHEHFLRTYLLEDDPADELREKGKESSPSGRASRTSLPGFP